MTTDSFDAGFFHRIRHFFTATFGGFFKTAFGAEAAKGTPAVMGFGGYALTQNFWIGLATFIYIVVQIVYLVRKWHREETDWRDNKRVKDEHQG